MTKEDGNIASIELELSKLRKVLHEKNTVRACLFNLIIYTDESRRVSYFHDMILRIIEKFPCRIIFIQTETTPNHDFLTANISTETISLGDSTIACDQITLKAGGNQISRIPFIILPYLASDLPIYLLWGQDPTKKNDIFMHLQKFATNIIFDSESTDHLQKFSQIVLKLINTLNIEIIDMNWTRTSGWREVLAKIFNTPERSQQLANCKLLKIRYNNRPNEAFRHQAIQSIYLQAWLATQLGWEPRSIICENNILRFSYLNKNKNLLTVDLSPEIEEHLPSGVVLSVEAVTESQNSFAIARKDSSPFVRIEISSKETCELPITLLLRNQQRNFSFIKDLFYGGTSEHYPKMLQTITKMEFPS